LYLAGGLAKEVDNGLLVFIVLFSDRSSDYAAGRNSTADANNRVKIFHKFAQKAIVNNIKEVIADGNEFN
jgi:hypothetical protein